MTAVNATRPEVATTSPPRGVAAELEDEAVAEEELLVVELVLELDEPELVAAAEEAEDVAEPDVFEAAADDVDEEDEEAAAPKTPPTTLSGALLESTFEAALL
ncbi:hypothetical protein H2198_004441 [Neophaeococcomyces mojaviensis]|uniref:Uncharacterized protein n=1 Tax=Neophaeococcomyces mojaviensis TaxID=3383035 RepID=A0ACC3A8R9_9EURO|nr:hypothetical protein H2198_004441 [Knufia sp. JES_112]